MVLDRLSRGFRLLILVATWMSLPAADGAAQTIRVFAEEQPLAEALRLIGAQARVDLVYAESLVDGRTVTCRYEGESVDAALACVLGTTALSARRVNARQYVLVAASERAPPSAARLGRGTLSGFVFDSETGDALPGAHVYLPDRRRGATTNEAGYFSFPSQRRVPQRVLVSYLGYHGRDTLLVPGGSAARLASQFDRVR